MSDTSPPYSFVLHLHFYHVLIAQKVLELATSVFFKYGDDFKITLQTSQDQYAILFIGSSQPIPEEAAVKFGDLMKKEPLLRILGGHIAYGADLQGGDTLVSPQLFTIYATNNFGKLSLRYGEGKRINKELEKHLIDIPVGRHFLMFIKGHILLFLESKTPFDKKDIEKITQILSHKKIKIRNQYQNF